MSASDLPQIDMFSYLKYLPKKKPSVILENSTPYNCEKRIDGKANAVNFPF